MPETHTQNESSWNLSHTSLQRSKCTDYTNVFLVSIKDGFKFYISVQKAFNGSKYVSEIITDDSWKLSSNQRYTYHRWGEHLVYHIFI